jgi:hypothetical protein
MQKFPYALDVYALSDDLNPPSSTMQTIWGVAALASGVASCYHGYKRNDSVGWAVGWFALGMVFPIITPVIAVAQGYAKPAKAKQP